MHAENTDNTLIKLLVNLRTHSGNKQSALDCMLS